MSATPFSTIRRFAHNALCALLIALLGSGCATQQPQAPQPNQFDIDLENAPQGDMDIFSEKRSQALHSFLVGRLQLTDRDFDQALQSFEAASGLIEEPNASVSSVLAELYLKRGNLRKAKREIERAIEDDPDAEEYRFFYAGVLESLGEDRAAEEQYRLLLEREGVADKARIFLANLMARIGEPERSLPLLDQVLKDSPESFVALRLKGRVLEALDRPKESLRYFQRAFQQRRLDSEVHADLLRAALKIGSPEKIKAVGKEILEADPHSLVAKQVLGELAVGERDFARALTLLRGAQRDAEDPNISLRFRIALLELQQRNFKAAEQELSLIIASEPEHAEARYYLASLYAGSGRREEAFQLLGEIAPHQEMFIKARMFRSFLLRQLERWDDAEKDLRAVLQKEPDNRKALSYLLMVFRNAERYEDGIALLDARLESEPDSPELLFEYGLLLDGSGEAEEAVEVMERVIELDPENADAANYVAYFLAEEERELERAEQLVTKALSKRPRDGYYLDTLGWILFKQGKAEEAVEILKEAAALAAGDPVILEHYGIVLRELGRGTEAKAVFERALDAAKNSDVSSEEDQERLEEAVEDLSED